MNNKQTPEEKNGLKTCFVISPIGEAGSETRKRSDQVLNYIITPALAAAGGYKAIRADQISEPGLITSQIIQHIIDDPLVIADLTESNPNVFYELAIRHVLRKPMVQIIKKGDNIPFDVAGMRTIPIDHHDLDSVNEAKGEIERQIRAVEGRMPNEIESPISASIEIQSLRRSDRPEDRTLAQILTIVGQLSADFASFEKKYFETRETRLPSLLDEVRKELAQNDNEKATLQAKRLMSVTRINQLTSELSRQHVDSPNYAELQKEIGAEQLKLRIIENSLVEIESRRSIKFSNLP